MGEPKLSADELFNLRQYAKDTPTCPSSQVRRLLDEHASLERDLAELREAAWRLRSHVEQWRKAWHSEALMLDVLGAYDALAALLPAEPPKEASDGK